MVFTKKPVLLFILGLAVVGLGILGWQIQKHPANTTDTADTSTVTTDSDVSQTSTPTTNTETKTPTPPPAPKTTGTSSSTPKQTTPSSGSGGGQSSGGGSGSTPVTTAWWSTSTAGSGSLIPASQFSDGGCTYNKDTWSGDAAGVGYTVTHLADSTGNPSSFSVKINANSNNTEVVGYPDTKCVMYAALPANLNSSFSITPPASSSGLDYEFAYDIWLTTAAKATSFDWDGDLELMIWNYTVAQKPAGYYDGGFRTTLSDGSKVYVDGNNSTGIVSVLMPSNLTSGNVNISNLVSILKSKGYVNSSYNGILDLEYGIEAPYGGNQTFTVNSLSVRS
jgi:hypothetical protein